MKTDKINTISAVVLLLVVSAMGIVIRGSAAEAPVEAESAKISFKPVYDNPTPGQIPLVAWNVVPPEYKDTVFLSQEYFEDIHLSGINIISNMIGQDARGERIIDMARQTGLKVMVQQLPHTAEAGHRMAEYYLDNSAVVGYLLQDEPNADMFASLAKVRNAIYSVDTTRLVYTNLLPIVPSKFTHTDTYLQYMEEAERILRLPLLSYDLYPVIEKEGHISIKPDFYENLEYARRVSSENGIPFWAFGLIMGHYSYPVPTLAHLRFETFNALAYGAQGIQYWRYAISSNPSYKATAAPVDSVGRRMDVWYSLRKVNQEIQGYAPVFLGCEVKNVGHLGTVPQGTEMLRHLPGPFTSIRPGSSGILVSHIVNGGRNYVVLCNHDILKRQKVGLRWKGRIQQVLPDGTRQTFTRSKVSLEPGSYAIFTY